MSEGIRRRPTRQVERLLERCERSYLSLVKSTRYAEVSAHHNRGRWLEECHELEIAWWSAAAMLRWVLGIGLTDKDWEHLPLELEEALAEPEPGDPAVALSDNRD